MVMRFGKPPGVPCPPNNPHCQGLEPVEACIDNPIFIILLVLFGILLVYFTIKNRKK